MIERQSVFDTPEPIRKWLRMPYEFARDILEKVKGLSNTPKVLDISCGNGVNQYLLNSAEVYSVDYHDNEFGLKRYSKIDLNNKELRLPFKDNFFDIVLSCETIEHLKEENHVGFIKELIRVSKVGVFCGTVATDGVDELEGVGIYKASLGNNEFHLKEYSSVEFRNFFNQFSDVAQISFLYGGYPSYKITREEPDIPKEHLISTYTFLAKELSK